MALPGSIGDLNVSFHRFQWPLAAPPNVGIGSNLGLSTIRQFAANKCRLRLPPDWPVTWLVGTAALEVSTDRGSKEGRGP